MEKKIITILILGAMILSLFTGCGKEKKEQEYEVFYLNSDVTKLMPEVVEPEHTEGTELIEELLTVLQTQPDDAGMLQTIPDDVTIQSVNVTSYQINVDFSKEYYNMDSAREILTRAAIAKTLLQNTDYLYVVFTVNQQSIVNANGVAVGAMSLDSFVENPGQQISSSQKTILTLYFSNKEGTALVPETREVHYSSNISLEKLVIEQLMEGPKEKGRLATIPSGTKLITISVVDGVCYVNLDEMFLNQNQEISEQVVLYSVVDSLTELSTIDKVQISINGDTSGKCRYTYDLATMYKEDRSIVEENLNEEGIESTE
jgi:germination protein M